MTSPTQAAAEFYREELGWPVGCTTAATWIWLPRHIDALVIPEPLALRLRLAGAAVRVPGGSAYRVFLVSPPATSETEVSVLAAYGITHRSYRELVDLPPTSTDTGPLIWVIDPAAVGSLPSVAEVIRRVRETGELPVR